MLGVTLIAVHLQGGGQAELVRGGSDLEVTPANVHDYVRKYAEFRMIRSAEKALDVSLWFDMSVTVQLK